MKQLDRVINSDALFLKYVLKVSKSMKLQTQEGRVIFGKETTHPRVCVCV